MPANILNLPSYHIEKIETNEHNYHISAIVIAHPNECPNCSSIGFVGFGRREQMVRDLPMHGKRARLYINTRRFRCRSCNKTFFETLPDVDLKRDMTTRLVAWIGKQSIRRTFASIADEVGCSEFTVRAVFGDYVIDLKSTVRFETPKWMGIDEIHLIKPRRVITNIQNNTIVDLLKNRNKETIINYLGNLDGKEHIQYVSMDMWAPYRDACIAVIPDAKIVIDKFHVVKMANEAVEKVRKGLRANLTMKERRGLMHDRYVLLKRERQLTDEDSLKLSGWIKNYAELGLAYRLKEDFFKIYDCSSPDEAQGMYLEWKARITPEVEDAFHDLVRAWDNWRPWILGYFDHPITNAYTESLNNLIRVMNQLGRGYSFEALRAKILFSEGSHKHTNTKPKFERKTNKTTLADMPEKAMKDKEYKDQTLQSSTRPKKNQKNYGVDISMLVQMINDGSL